jgi:hypothetical protein
MRFPNQAPAVVRHAGTGPLFKGIEPSCNWLQCGEAVIKCGSLFLSGDIAGGIACLASNGWSGCRDCF